MADQYTAGPFTLTQANPKSEWFTPVGDFELTRDAGSGTVAIFRRPTGAPSASPGLTTGAALTDAGSQVGSWGRRATRQMQFVLTSGTGPVVCEAIWS